jgi:hypothetical protein
MPYRVLNMFENHHSLIFRARPRSYLSLSLFFFIVLDNVTEFLKLVVGLPRHLRNLFILTIQSALSERSFGKPENICDSALTFPDPPKIGTFFLPRMEPEMSRVTPQYQKALLHYYRLWANFLL